MLFNKIKYLGGAPYPFDRIMIIDIMVDRPSSSLIIVSRKNNDTFILKRNAITDVQTDIIKERSVSKGIIGYCIGNFFNKRYGGLIGAAIGARNKDDSNIHITYYMYNSFNTLILNSGKKTWDLYAAIIGL
jgi:hypothetical protein